MREREGGGSGGESIHNVYCNITDVFQGDVRTGMKRTVQTESREKVYNVKKQTKT